MPNTREKMIELLGDKLIFGRGILYEVANHLISHGVTVQNWIPVTERLPDGMDWVLCACKDDEVRMLCYDYIMDDWDIYNRPNSCYAKGFVTYWMPLPQPPKGD